MPLALDGASPGSCLRPIAERVRSPVATRSTSTVCTAGTADDREG
jgi:hypothetical protein